MQTFPVIPGYYANTRQMLLKLSQRNMTKMQTTTQTKSLHNYFTVITATEHIVLGCPCAELCMQLFVV